MWLSIPWGRGPEPRSHANRPAGAVCRPGQRGGKKGGSTRAFVAREQHTGRLLGGCELRIQPRGSAHVSYWISPADRGYGYATRSLVLLLRYARTIGIRQAKAHIAADNHASRRVAEKAELLSVTAFTAADGTGMVQYLINLTNSTY